MRTRLLCVWMVLCFTVSGFSYKIPDTVEQKLQAVIDSFVTARPDIKGGISVSIKTKKGQWSYARGPKRMDTPGDEITPETPFMIFSITKNIVSAYALDLVRRGDLRLSDTIGMYHDFENVSCSVSNSITIEQLLCHRSGLGEFKPYWAQGEWDPFEFISLVKSPMFEPGTAFTYSSSNTLILGLIIQLVTGEDLNISLKRRFFDRHNIDVALIPQDAVPSDPAALHAPLSVLDTTLPDTVAIYSDVMRYEWYGMSGWTAGCMMSTAPHIAQWGYDLFSNQDNGFKWIGKKMKRSIDTANVFLPFDWQMGLGAAYIPQIGEKNFGFHGYGTGTASSMYYLPGTKSCITIFVNQTDVNHSTHAVFLHFPLTTKLNAILREYRDTREQKRDCYKMMW